MDVEITIRYSDDRLCAVAVARPDSSETLYEIATPRRHSAEFAEGLQEARRLFEIEPWTNGKPH
jgi:hypothetical protein